jgi:hypothetical protein
MKVSRREEGIRCIESVMMSYELSGSVRGQTSMEPFCMETSLKERCNALKPDDGGYGGYGGYGGLAMKIFENRKVKTQIVFSSFSFRGDSSLNPPYPP